MTRADDNWARLKTEGLDAVRHWIKDKTEGNWLDFKQYGDRSSNRKNLAKALSGFANTDGGMLVWGVEELSADPPFRMKPFREYHQLNREILDSVSKSVTPFVMNVDSIAIDCGSDHGIVATYIPVSNTPPHRCTIDDKEVQNHYYMRIGSDFRVIPHGFLAALFGRRPETRIQAQFSIEPQPRYDRRNLSLRPYIFLKSLGPTIARNLYFTAQAAGLRSISMVGRRNSGWAFTGGTEQAVGLSSPSDFHLPPLSQILVGELHLDLPAHAREPIVIETIFGHGDTLPTTTRNIVTPEQLAQAYKEIESNLNASEGTEQFVQTLLGPEVKCTPYTQGRAAMRLADGSLTLHLPIDDVTAIQKWLRQENDTLARIEEDPASGRYHAHSTKGDRTSYLRFV